PAAAAHLRHGVAGPEAARRLPEAPSGDRAPRPPRAREGARALPHRRGARFRSRPLAAEPLDRARGARDLVAQDPPRARLHARLHAAYRAREDLPTVGAPREVRREHVWPTSPR